MKSRNSQMSAAKRKRSSKSSKSLGQQGIKSKVKEYTPVSSGDAEDNLTNSKQVQNDLEKKEFEEYSQALLLSTSDREPIRKIAREKDAKLLKRVILLDHFQDQELHQGSSEKKKEIGRKKYESCLYRLFMLFTNPNFADRVYSTEVLNWLFTKEIEKIIKEKDGSQMRMINLIVLSNNLYATKWAFEKYKEEEIKKIFNPPKGSEKEDIFKNIVDGITSMEDSSLNPNVEIIGAVLDKFENSIEDNARREEEVSKKKDSLKKLLEEQIDSELSLALDNQLK